jgi:pyruvate dehydrogenase E2 component (dihydrolipoamide acetyltransferase)
MAIEVKLPDIGEGVTEGEIVRWLVKEGDMVKHDQPLLEVMTDKATVEIPSTADGKVVKLLAKEGQVVKVGGALMSIDGAAASGGAESPKTKPQPAAGQVQAQTQAPRASAPMAAAPTGGSYQASGGLGAGMAAVVPPAAGANVMATPATRRYAREAGVDLNQMRGSGPNGRITREDVVRASGNGGGGLGATAAARPQYQAPSGHAPMPAYQPPAYRPTPLAPQAGEERKPLRGIRKKIAENLVRSKQIIPHFTHVDELDATELVKWRTSTKPLAEERGVKLTYLPLIMKALVATCREFPALNASIDDAAGEIVYKHTFNVGFAADTPEGLLVPNVKNVENKAILEIAHDITTLAEKARSGKLGPDDMRHGTITITNIGSVGGIYATPIINHPEVAIIGVYEIQKKPVVRNGEIVIRDMMNITATCDHRLVDGAMAARFIRRLKARLENPQSLMLEMI